MPDSLTASLSDMGLLFHIRYFANKLREDEMKLLIKEHLGKFSTEFMLINIDSDQFQYIQNFIESHAHQYSSILVRNKVDDLEFTNYMATESINNCTIIDARYILEISNIDKSTLLMQISELKQRLRLIPVINTAAIYSAGKLIWEVL